MSKRLQVKYLKLDRKRGQYRYRRRVPDGLVKILGKREFVKVLGRTETEALRAYPGYHDYVENLISGTSSPCTVADPKEIKGAIYSLFSEYGFDLRSPGRTENEVTGRDAMADQIFAKYGIDEETGYPDPEDMSAFDHAMASALLAGIQAVDLPCTVNVAFDFYLQERREPDEYKRKKQIQRLTRAKNALFEAIKVDLPLKEVSRHHARIVRDRLLQDKSPETVKRMFNDLKAVFNLAIREFEIAMVNPFSRLELPRPHVQAIDKRLPLPNEIISAMYRELESSQDVLDVWTLVHHTGAQPAEILGLTGIDLLLDSDTPHLKVRPNDFRGLKQIVRERSIPLVELGLEVAQKLLARMDSLTEPVFPRFAPTREHDDFSQFIMRRLRRHTTAKEHVFYSLRHTMKDKLIEVGATERQQHAILGHTMGASASEGYGSRPRLAELREVIGRIDFRATYPWISK